MTTLRTALIASAVTAFTAVGAAPADAWKVTNTGVNPQTITFAAATGEVNSPTVERAGNGNDVLRFRDTGGAPNAGSDCTASAEFQFVQCFALGTNDLVFGLGDRNDTMLYPGTVTGILSVKIAGGDGNDTLSNGLAAGTVSGDAGSDVLRPGKGQDTVRGGTGLDVVDYSDRTAPVTTNLNTINGNVQAVNGEADEKDSIDTDVEGILGGSGADSLTGSARDEQIVPGKGADKVFAQGGQDIIDSRDGTKDTIECGIGADQVLADQTDTVNADCEAVTRYTVALAPAPGNGPPLPAPPPPLPPQDAPLVPTDPPAGGTPTGPGPGTGTGGGTGGPGTSGDTRRPVVSTLRLSARTITRTGRRPRFSTLSFAVSEPASVTVSVARIARGGRLVPMGKRTLASAGGKMKLKLGTTFASRPLKAGAGYRVTVVATDAAKNRSKAVRGTLRVAAK